ncbi:hypothetical protein CSTERTH_12810 [Thermoclostridium stercorarium subsp. thermolacticum DSM 2910]|jgi:uncharacterized FlaG/YvyC family protein|uniref:Uncharacterized protein n=2 Tax=Thermoclostridium stercorarium TaxID=1510 RepID=A0A1B1YNY1_THEST|nr:hypothetical protein [Thermoclostridium stercorarium]ANW99848.1 hypothetical protein CSTERTH_12810 [Thermoclostridium stercorarium subsp. thermolacticum DSM 2910]ANX02473.1 hypothetical protein CSTERLE_13305 [Thermoclostridium stercorarium subsp. leptospartum DSM 9219]
MLQNNKRNAGQGKNNNNLTKQTNAQKNKSQKETARDGFAKKRNDLQKRPSQRISSEQVAARISNPKREETIEDIRMDIEKLEKEIQFEIKQIRSTKLGL